MNGISFCMIISATEEKVRLSSMEYTEKTICKLGKLQNVYNFDIGTHIVKTFSQSHPISIKLANLSVGTPIYGNTIPQSSGFHISQISL